MSKPFYKKIFVRYHISFTVVNPSNDLHSPSGVWEPLLRDKLLGKTYILDISSGWSYGACLIAIIHSTVIAKYLVKHPKASIFTKVESQSIEIYELDYLHVHRYTTLSSTSHLCHVLNTFLVSPTEISKVSIY